MVGTQVKEEIDAAGAVAARAEWIDRLGIAYLFHRSFSWLVLLLHVGLILKLRKTEGAKVFPLTLILLILGTILTGLSMAFRCSCLIFSRFICCWRRYFRTPVHAAAEAKP